MSLPALWRVYAGVSAALASWIHRRDARRLAAQGVTPGRVAERRGIATLDRPEGALIWLHAVSVGEAQSILGLAARLARKAAVLITTTSATSAQLVAERLPEGCQHQFAPLDTPGAVRRFLDHWRPALFVLTESEIWPRQIVECDRRGIPVALVNARLSDRSLENWRRAAPLARTLLGKLALVQAQDKRTAEGLVAMGLPRARISVAGTLKSAAEPLPADPAKLATLRAATGERPVWVAASTHPGEEAPVLAAHRDLLATRPGLLLILAPRHPERGSEVAGEIDAAGLTYSRRSAGALPEAQVYLADTLGELGLWFRLSPVAVIGGGFREIGGHNPLEPVRLGAHAITGPHVTNFAGIYAELIAEGRASMVQSAGELPDLIAAMLDGGHQADRTDEIQSPHANDLVSETASRLLGLIRNAR